AMPTVTLMKTSPPARPTMFSVPKIFFLRLGAKSRLTWRRNVPLQIRLHLLHLQTERPLHLKNLPPLVARNQCGGHAFLARAPRTADAMNKVLCNLRQIVVDDVHDVLHMDAARCHVRSDQDLIASLLESR